MSFVIAHGGRHIVFEDCESHNCDRAFILTYAANLEGAYAPRYCGFRRCKAVNPPASLSARGEGFWIHDAYNSSDVIQDYATGCFIEDCLFDGYGYERTGASLTLGCGLVKSSWNAVVKGNVFKETIGNVIYMDKENIDFSVLGNQAFDWRSERGNPAFIRFLGGSNSGVVHGNTAREFNGAHGTYTAELGIRSETGLSGLTVSYSGKYMGWPTPVSMLTATIA